MLGNQNYSPEVIINNGQTDSYKFNRIEYYLSSFSITHDSGKIATFPSTYLLLKAGQDSFYKLGEADVGQLEAVSFAVGVDSANNYQDPSAWPTDHPLAPKFPSMHWGWIAGYRFAVIEGLTGTAFSNQFNVHGLGVRNYKLQTHQVTGKMENGNLVIELNADYLMTVSDMTVDANLNYHGEFEEGSDLLDNFWRRVFSEKPVGIQNANEEKAKIKLGPNPTEGTLLLTSEEEFKNLEYRIFGLNGKLITSGIIDQKEAQIHIETSGVYLLGLYRNGQKIQTEKIVVR